MLPLPRLSVMKFRDYFIEKLVVCVCMKVHRHTAMHLRYIIWEDSQRGNESVVKMLSDPTYEETCAIARKCGTGFHNWLIIESDCPECHQEVLCRNSNE